MHQRLHRPVRPTDFTTELSILTLALVLKKQAAQAMIDARHLIVKGAVSIAMEAVDELGSKGLQMDEKAKYDLVSSLLIVTTGDKDAQPTLSL